MRFIAYILISLLTVCLWSCANPGSGPDGGPYDETPPKIVAMSPVLGAKQVGQKKVVITFDELIKVENAQEKVVVSPPQIETPEIKTSGRRISVEMTDTLKPGTTYTIDFSDAIVDSNEGNALGNFTYYFSTGEQLDTMEVAGHVLNAADLEPVKGIMVGLHRELADSAFWALPFDRVARTDGNGHFSIKGVAAGKYRIYALKDMDGDYKYARGEMLAFSRDTITPTSFPDIRHDTLWIDTVRIDTIRTIPYTHYLPDDMVLFAFSEQNVTRQLLKTQREPEWFKIFFTAPSKHTPVISGLNFRADDAWLMERSAGNDTITCWLRDTTLVNRDSLVVTCEYEATDDSTGINSLRTDTLELVPRIKYERRMKLAQQDLEKWEKQRERRHKRGDYSQETPPVKPLKLECSARTTMAPDKNLHFTLPEPAASLDTSAIHLYLKVDSTYREAPYRLSRDSLTLLNYTLRAEWRPGQEYVLNVDSACITGLSGKINHAYDAKFKIATTDTYGSLFLIIPDADSTATVQLMQGSDKVVKQQRVRDGRTDFFYLEPGDYYVRLFFDNNLDGSWTTGDYKNGQQAEKVYYFPQKFTVRANWDIEQEWRLNAVPPAQQKPRELIKQKEDTKKTPKSRNAERERAKRG